MPGWSELNGQMLREMSRRRSLTPKGLVVVICASLALCSASEAAAAPGDLDESFSSDGLLQPAVDFSPRLLAALADGKLLAVGYVGLDLAVTRYNADGSTDTSFGNAGRVVTPACRTLQDMAVDLQGRIVVASNESVCRLTANGSLDSSFSGDGVAPMPIVVVDVAVDALGGVAVGGGYAGDFAVARLSPDGAFDLTFSEDGLQVSEVGGSDLVTSLEFQTDGRLIAAGDAFNDANRSRSGILRYNADGSLDQGFGTLGRVTSETRFDDLLLRPDQHLVAAGFSGDGSRIEVFTPDGRPDDSFDGDGALDLRDTRLRLGWDVMAASPDSALYVAASVSHPGPFARFRAAVIKIAPSGIPDVSFGGAGLAFMPGFTPTAIGVQPDGRVVVLNTVRNGHQFARLEILPGPGDADADQIVNDADVCGLVFGPPPSGCPDVAREVEIRERSRRLQLKGRVRSNSLPCRDAPLLLRRRAPGVDARIDQVVPDKGRFEFHLPPRPGNYYVHAPRRLEPSVGICLSARSDPVRV